MIKDMSTHTYDKKRIAEVKYLDAFDDGENKFPRTQYLPGAPLEYFSKELAAEICENWNDSIDANWLGGCLCCAAMLSDGGGIKSNASRWVEGAIDDITFLRAIKMLNEVRLGEGCG